MVQRYKLESGGAKISTEVSQSLGDRACPEVEPQHNVQGISGVKERSIAFDGRRQDTS